jgi:predicted metalloprotease with PDZ domain
MPPSTLETGTPVQYLVSLTDVDAHLFEVTIRVADPTSTGQRFALPAWTPGSYMIRDFARHLVAISAQSPEGAVTLVKTDKHSWYAAPCKGPLSLTYQVYAYDTSVRAAYLDARRGFLTGSAVLMRALDQPNGPLALRLHHPDDPRLSDWRVATTLQRVALANADPEDPIVESFGDFVAQSYDELVDHPIEFGRFEVVRFEAGGRPHSVVIAGRHDTDLPRLAHDFAQICSTQARLFEPESGLAPFERYLFLINVTADGYGGLEHRASTALLCAREALPYRGMTGLPKAYRSLLGLASHEYFHAWHVKRIRPQALIDAEPGAEAYTRLLWIFEGFTSYYDDLILVRSGLLSHETYLGLLGETCAAVLKAPGRHHQSVAESSFDAWIKYYRQDENSPNSIVSYYAKGSLVALAIDLTIRARTEGKHSLDDVMRLLWNRFGKSEQAFGLSEDGFGEIIEEATGLDLHHELAQWVEGTTDLPLPELLLPLDIQMKQEAATDEPVSLGLWTAQRGHDLVAKTVLKDGPAMRAGLSAGDVLIAMDGLRVNETSLKNQLGRKRPGDRVCVHAFRRDELLTIDIELEAPRAEVVTLKILKRGSGTEGGVEHAELHEPDRRGLQAEQARRSAWLGESPTLPATNPRTAS